MLQAELKNNPLTRLERLPVLSMSRYEMKSNLWRKLIGHFYVVELLTTEKNKTLIIVLNRQEKEENPFVSVRSEKKLNSNVGKREYNDEWNTAIELLQQSYGRKNRKNLRLLPHSSCFVGWEHIHRNNCLQDENHEKIHQLFSSKHGHVRSAVSDFCDSSRDTEALYRLLADRWSSWPGLM